MYYVLGPTPGYTRAYVHYKQNYYSNNIAILHTVNDMRNDIENTLFIAIQHYNMYTVYDKTEKFLTNNLLRNCYHESFPMNVTSAKAFSLPYTVYNKRWTVVQNLYDLPTRIQQRDLSISFPKVLQEQSPSHLDLQQVSQSMPTVCMHDTAEEQYFYTEAVFPHYKEC